VYNEGGNFELFGGVISDNTLITISASGGGVYNEGGNFSMYGGEISNNTVSNGAGGGVYLTDSGSFALYDGVISDNRAAYGGGVYINNGAFNMLSGVISSNRATTDGGGVYIENVLVRLSGGVISDNTASSNGGGVWIDYKNLYRLFVEDGMVFSNNHASVAYDRDPEHIDIYRNCIGDNVNWTIPFLQGYNNYDISYTSGTQRLVYSVIVANSYAASSGAGRYMAGTLIVVDAGTRDGYLFSSWTLNEGDVVLPNNPQTSFIMPEGDVAITANWVADIGKYDIFYELDGGTNSVTNPTVYTTNNLPLSITAPSKTDYTFLGWSVRYADGTVVVMPGSFSISPGTVGDMVLTAFWVRTGSPIYVEDEAMLRNAVNQVASVTSVSIALERDIELSSALVIAADKTITLISHSETEFFRLVGASGVDTLIVEAGGVLELTGINVTHAADVFGRGVVVQPGGTLIMSNGAISDNTASGLHGGGVHNNGNFSLLGGEISNNSAIDGIGGSGWGGGVYNGGIFGMFGGVISGSRGWWGGGVYNTGTFEMSKGIIYSNTADSGGGVHNAGTFSLFGGVISDNTAITRGGGIWNFGGPLSMSGGEISNNTARSGGGIFNADSFSLFGGVIFGNTGGVYNVATFVMSGGEISDNNGIGVFNSVGKFSLFGGVISNNNGGGVYNLESFTMFGGVISNNIASNGGGVYNGASNFFARFTMFGGVISNNTAVAGGGVYMGGGFVELHNGSILGNTASNDGGGVWVVAENLGRLFVFDGITFSNNSASVAYDRAPLHDAVYYACIGEAVIWTEPFIQGYNNYDISYTNGMPFTFYTVNVTDSYAITSGAGCYVTGALVTLDAGSRVGYLFSGWTVNEGGVMLPNSPQTTFTMPANDIVVTANWAEVVPEYAITYKLEGGTNPTGNLEVYTVVDLPLSIADPTKQGYTFLGWIIEYADGTTISTSGSLIIAKDTTGNVTLTARWQAIDTGVLDAYDAVFVEFCSYYDVETWVFRRDLFAGYSVESVLAAERVMGIAGQVHADLLAVYGRLEAGRFGAGDDIAVINEATRILSQAIADMHVILNFEAEVTVVNAVPTAVVVPLNGNTNDLKITITEELSNGTTHILTETFSINNNAADTYPLGSYRVYVDTKGNTQIRACYLV
jgi:uncharacterized repeat protein (TIGR02543 family)